MKIQRPTVSLVSSFVLGGLLSACASAGAVPVQAAVAEDPRSIEPQRPTEILAAKPYAPQRVADGPGYLWQRPKPIQCAADAPKPAVLTFSGSVGIFPLLSDEELERAQADADAREALGAAEEPVAKRASNPELVVAGLRPRFRRCFSRWTDEKANAQGSVRFALELGCAGNVQAITADDVRGVDEPTLACLFTVVGPAQFDPPANGHATIQVPVVYKSAAR